MEPVVSIKRLNRIPSQSASKIWLEGTIEILVSQCSSSAFIGKGSGNAVRRSHATDLKGHATPSQESPPDHRHSRSLLKEPTILPTKHLLTIDSRASSQHHHPPDFLDRCVWPSPTCTNKSRAFTEVLPTTLSGNTPRATYNSER